MSLAYILVFTAKLNSNFIWSYWNKLWSDLVLGMTFMLSNLFANSAFVASTSSFERYMKFIPSKGSLQKLNIAVGVTIWSPVALPKLANLVNLLTVSPSTGCFPWEVAKKTHLASIPNSEQCWLRLNKFFWFLYWIAQPAESKWHLWFQGGQQVLFQELHSVLGIPLQHSLPCHGI